MACFLSVGYTVDLFIHYRQVGLLAAQTASMTGWSQVRVASVSTGSLSLCHCVEVSLSKTLKHDLLLTSLVKSIHASLHLRVM